MEGIQPKDFLTHVKYPGSTHPVVRGDDLFTINVQIRIRIIYRDRDRENLTITNKQTEHTYTKKVRQQK